MGVTHEIYNKLYKESTDNQLDKSALYKIISSDNINDTDASGCTLLHLSAARGDLELVQFLLDKDADISILDGSEWSALRFAVEAITEKNFVTQDAIIKCLLQKKANIDERESGFNYTALHNAATSGNVIQAQILIDNGASLSALTSRKKTARRIVEESSHRNKEEMLKLFDTPVSTIRALTSRHSIFSSSNLQSETSKPNVAPETAEPEKSTEDVQDKTNHP